MHFAPDGAVTEHEFGALISGLLIVHDDSGDSSFEEQFVKTRLNHRNKTVTTPSVMCSSQPQRGERMVASGVNPRGPGVNPEAQG